MKSFTLLLLVVFAYFVHADRTVQGSLLTTTDVNIVGSADGRVTINLGLVNTPPTLVVTSDGATTISIDAVVSGSLSLALPTGQGIAALGLVGYAALEISSSNTSATVTFQLTTPNLSALFTASTQVAGIFYTNGAAYVNIPSTTSSGQLTANLPGVGTYVFVSIDKTLTASYGVARTVLAGVNRTYQWASDFAIQYSSQAANTITVVASNVTAQGTVESRAAIGTSVNVFFSITLGASASHVSTIQYTYSDAELIAAGLTADAAAGLRWAYYDTVSSAWTLADQASSVDVNAKVVAQVTTHFSEWGLYYNSATTNLVSFYLIVSLLLFAML